METNEPKNPQHQTKKYHPKLCFVTFLQMFVFIDKRFQYNVAGNGGSLCIFYIYTS